MKVRVFECICMHVCKCIYIWLGEHVFSVYMYMFSVGHVFDCVCQQLCIWVFVSMRAWVYVSICKYEWARQNTLCTRMGVRPFPIYFMCNPIQRADIRGKVLWARTLVCVCLQYRLLTIYFSLPLAATIGSSAFVCLICLDSRTHWPFYKPALGLPLRMCGGPRVRNFSELF